MNIDFDLYGKVVCAALFHDDSIYMSELGHHTIFSMEAKGVLRNAKQGFVTENGYFVDRELGLSIAEHFDQIDDKHFPLDKLVSEDLKKEDLKVLNRVKEYNYRKNNA